MNWKQSSEKYKTELKTALSIYRHAKSLADLPAAGVSPQLIEKLSSHVAVAEKQLQRLEADEFRIAVVGLEKAGKSTFVNAWLGCDLLPSDAIRCTYTPTQIFAVTSESDQRVEVTPKSESQFSALIEELKKSPLKEAQQDLETIENNISTLHQAIRSGPVRIPFVTLESVRPDLQKYVADQRYAHAIEEVRLYTTNLASVDGVVFYDVPGMDSGLSKTIDDNARMLSDCDAIIIVMRDPSLKGSEKQLLTIAVDGDTIPVAEKLFVFLGRSDTQATAGAWTRMQEEAKKSWAERGVLVPENRFVSGSAGAHLLLDVPNLSPKTREQLGTSDDMVRKLSQLHGESLSRESAIHHTGIGVIKQSVANYLQNERSGLLARRCGGAIQSITEAAQEIYREVRQRVPEDPEELRVHGEFIKIDTFSKWWGNDTSGKWMRLRQDANNYFQGVVLKAGPNNTRIVAAIESWLAGYKDDIAKRIQSLPARLPQERDSIFQSCSNPEFSAAIANQKWRERLYMETIESIQGAAAQLASNLAVTVESLRAKMQELLWGSPRVAHIMAESSALDKNYLENALRVLFLRFARPVADVLIRAPLASQTRISRIAELGADIELMYGYFDPKANIDPAFVQPGLYARHGFSLLTDKEKRRERIGDAKVIAPKIETAKRLLSGQPDPSNKNSEAQSVIDEVEGDLVGLEVVLSEALFHASGFAGFCYSELQGMMDMFLSLSAQWRGLAEIEWRTGNPALMSELPGTLKTLEVDTEVSSCLGNLREALQRIP